MKNWIKRSKQFLHLSMLLCFCVVMYFPIEKLYIQNTGISFDYLSTGVEFPSMTICPFLISKWVKSRAISVKQKSHQEHSKIIRIAIWQSRQVSCLLANIEGVTCPRTYMVYIP
jgi:hypothetical protein